MKVLLVEDEDAIAEPLAKGLRREGFAVERVASGLAALEAPEPDLVLLDLGLPDTDGFTVCRELRSRSSVPIIMRHREGRGDRPGRRPRGRRGRLHRQAVRLPRADRADPRRHPADGRAPATPGARGAGAARARHARPPRRSSTGEEIDLTPKEFDLLALLASDPGAVVPRGAHPRGGLGDDLVREREDDRRPRGGAAQEARRSVVDRDRARRRASPARPDVSRRFLATYVALAVVVLAALEIPLGIQYGRSERRDLTGRIERDALTMATFAEDTLERGLDTPPAPLVRVAKRYQRRARAGAS